jgi:hypothetical protein
VALFLGDVAGLGLGVIRVISLVRASLVNHQRIDADFYESVLGKRCHDSIQIDPDDFFEPGVGNVAGRHKEQTARATIDKKRLHEVAVLGNDHAILRVCQVADLCIGSTIPLRQIERMSSVMPG